ncbi:hypothetical protein C0992_002651 [Termitomyces sp. T32_za158]|nr:hypothetical protein C0992_002651 [Termitomyces sp. T32_za158]
MDPNRVTRLTKLFEAILHGKQTIIPQNAKLFIEALCAQPDRAVCIRKLMSSKTGLDSLQSALRINLTPVFFNGPCADLLEYLQLPDLQSIGSGQFLTDILLKIVDPAIFWDPFMQSFKDGTLKKRAQIGFAWLLHRLYRIQATDILKSLTGASDNDVLKTYGRRIQLVLEASATGKVPEGGDGPGGRHDNDFVDFRTIAILPTPSEMNSSETPFLRHSSAVDETEDSARVATHLDNQFRLLREDMLHEMREDLQTALGKKKNRRKGLTIDGLLLEGLNFGSERRRTRWGLQMESYENRNFLKHRSLGCLLVDGEIVSFVTLSREEELLVKTPPSIVLQVDGELAVNETLLKLKFATKVEFVSVDTAVFAYEHVLQALQRTTTLPLSHELLFWNSNSGPPSTLDSEPSKLAEFVRTLEINPRHDFQHLLHLAQSTKLDPSQAESLIAGLTQKVSLIQGPPGTGKSFIGSLIAKAIHDLTEKTILVVCYTNHALDDILTSLLDVGIPGISLVRLGGKSTDRTASLTMQSQNPIFRRSKEGWLVIDQVKNAAAEYEQDLHKTFKVFHESHVSSKDIMDHLEFEEPVIHTAFQVPSATGGFTRIASRGRVVDDFYLLDEWSAGRDGGVFKDDDIVKQAKDLWSMPLSARRELLKKWTTAIYEEQIISICTTAAAYNKHQDNLAKLFAEKDTAVLQNKRIIGCTTTAAAKYSDSLQAASPDVLLVEEAGEILESHVLTALSSKTSQLILIGDHKQLRPKVNNYKLTVENGEGYDLNKSLFERLILRDYPHAKLTSQHRMRPEISALIRELTYPELLDAQKTQNRPDVRGVQDNIVFIDHDHPEDNSDLSDRKDGGAKPSKQNSFEVDMVLKIFKYLVQQGYRSEEMVILTPYLGQLQLLKKALGRDQDAILSDLDIADLIAAGGNITSQKSSEPSKQRIRLATIGLCHSRYLIVVDPDHAI